RGEGSQPRTFGRDEILVGGDDVFAARDRAQDQLTCQAEAADAFDDDANRRIVDDVERVVREVVPGDVARLVRIAHGDAANQPRMRGQQTPRDARTHPAAT